jgi:peptidoglycan-N-acetylglucosamine deacetylase
MPRLNGMASLKGSKPVWWAGWFRPWKAVAVLTAVAFFAWGGWIWIAVFLGLLVVLGFGVARPGWRFFGHIVVDAGDPGKIALTFDDGPDPAFTPDILGWLKAHGFVANFFLVGRKVRLHPDLARRIQAEGHLVASHTYDHSHFSNFRLTRALVRDLDRVRSAFRDVLGCDPLLHRPPVGLTNAHLFRALGKRGMTCICWNSAGRDAGNRRLAGIGKIGGLARPGAIVVLHDVLPKPELKGLVLEQLAHLAVEIDRQGLVTGRLDDLLGIPSQVEVANQGL